MGNLNVRRPVVGCIDGLGDIVSRNLSPAHCSFTAYAALSSM